MDEISIKYEQEAQKQLNYIKQVYDAFSQQCAKLKMETEQKIATLDKTDPKYKEKENLLKLDLKKALNKVLKDLEKELKQKFMIGLTELEKIYHQKELKKMQEIEQQILTLK